MRGFQEIKGQSTRLMYDRERATFLVKFEPHLFVSREAATKVQAKQNGDGTCHAASVRYRLTEG